VTTAYRQLRQPRGCTGRLSDTQRCVAGLRRWALTGRTMPTTCGPRSFSQYYGAACAPAGWMLH